MGCIILIILAILGCSQITGKAVGVPQESAKNPEVYFCPETDCSKIFEEKIESADFSAHCAFYDIDLKKVISALARKSKTADVKLVIDSDNYEGQIKGEGVRMDDGKQLMHDKFCVIDDGIVLTGSFNPTDNDNNYNNNNILVVYSSWLAQNYEGEFQELWNGEFGKGNRVKHPVLKINSIKMENYFCPEDDCAFRIANLIKDAKSSAKAAFFTFTSEKIADELLKAESRGVDVSVIVENRQRNAKNSQYQRLKDFGMDIKLDNNKYTMHHKVLIIDGKIVVTGSFNPTLSADTKNDENILIIHDEEIANRFLEEFGKL
jgi:phosphatidylserine/phosphatidylglycerophosphate/cardiolipin synthase-like enzyme